MGMINNSLRKKMKNRVSYSAVALAVFAAACADATAPIARDLAVAPPTLDVNTVQTVGAGIPAGTHYGDVVVCKQVSTGDLATNSFTFSVSVTNELGGTVTPVSIAAPVFTNVAPGQSPCQVVWHGSQNMSNVDRLVITETSQANWAVADIVVDQYSWGATQTTILTNMGAFAATLDEPNGIATVRGNKEKVTVVTFINDYTAPPPPPGGCTYTKGWYRNNGSSTVVDVDGRSAAEAQAIFKATPGKPNGVTWGADNNNLNLYQQLLAAMLNGGATGPAAVQTAIGAAQAATGGSGLNITVAAGTDVSGLISTLSQFNEGLLAGWPHCS